MNRLVLICEVGEVSDIVQEQHTEGQSYTPPPILLSPHWLCHSTLLSLLVPLTNYFTNYTTMQEHLTVHYAGKPGALAPVRAAKVQS